MPTAKGSNMIPPPRAIKEQDCKLQIVVVVDTPMD